MGRAVLVCVKTIQPGNVRVSFPELALKWESKLLPTGGLEESAWAVGPAPLLTTWSSAGSPPQFPH